MAKHICPKCGHNRFITSTHVAQSWEVDEYGNFIQETSTDETIHGPHNDNIWTCTRCGTEAILVDNDFDPDLISLLNSVQKIQDYCNVTGCNNCKIEKAICCGTNNTMKQPMCWHPEKILQDAGGK